MRTSDHADFDTSRARLRIKDVQHPFTAVSSLGLDVEFTAIPGAAAFAGRGGPSI